jgi:hypothetical protein
MNYTTERWIKLTKLMEMIANKQMDALQLRNYFDNKDDWEFATDRLTKLGLLYFKDLSASYAESMMSSNLAKDMCKDQDHYEEEMKLLFKPAECVAGLPIKLKTGFENSIGFLENLPSPDFYLSNQFVQNENDEPVLFVIN